MSEKKEKALNFQKALKMLVAAVGDPGTCRGCSAQVFWVRHRNGKKVPYTTDGFNHFIDCPSAARFRK